MKKLILLLIGLLYLTQSGYAQLRAKVDERFELTSIVFCLAGAPEHSKCGVPSYLKDISVLDSLYASTESIHYVRELNQTYYIQYAAVSATACLLEIKNGEIKLQPQYDISTISQFDKRWTEELFEKYLRMLNQFYKESNFHQFFQDHRELYELAEQRMNDHIAGTAIDWIESFFGKPFDPNIKIYISLVNGPNNYAMNEGILIGLMGDAEGLPAPQENMTLNVLIHEILHHYSNPLFLSYWEQMEKAANLIYPTVKDKMYKIAYGSARSTMCEWLNNLFVLMYEKENNIEHYRSNISRYIHRGFIWMERSVDFMEHFYANRELYPTIEEFMPQLVAFLNFAADNIDFIQREYDYARPYITNVYPAPGSDITEVEEIVITFSEPMQTFVKGFLPPAEDIEALQFEFFDSDWDNEYQFRLKLTPNKREPGRTYGIKLNPSYFQSTNYFTLDDKYIDLIFKTRL